MTVLCGKGRGRTQGMFGETQDYHLRIGSKDGKTVACRTGTQLQALIWLVSGRARDVPVVGRAVPRPHPLDEGDGEVAVRLPAILVLAPSSPASDSACLPLDGLFLETRPRAPRSCCDISFAPSPTALHCSRVCPLVCRHTD